MVGPMGLMGAPIIACFGWFYFPFVFTGYGIALIWWKNTTMSRKSFCLLLPICAAGVFAVVGVKEQGSLVQSILGNVLGAFISGVIGLLVLTKDQKRESNHQMLSTTMPPEICAGSVKKL